MYYTKVFNIQGVTFLLSFFRFGVTIVKHFMNLYVIKFVLSNLVEMGRVDDLNSRYSIINNFHR
jgi:hypothetical protein